MLKCSRPRGWFEEALQSFANLGLGNAIDVHINGYEIILCCTCSFWKQRPKLVVNAASLLHISHYLSDFFLKAYVNHLHDSYMSHQ